VGPARKVCTSITHSCSHPGHTALTEGRVLTSSLLAFIASTAAVGQAEEIEQAFAGFQKYLYQPQVGV